MEAIGHSRNKVFTHYITNKRARFDYSGHHTIECKVAGELKEIYGEDYIENWYSLGTVVKGETFVVFMSFPGWLVIQ